MQWGWGQQTTTGVCGGEMGGFLKKKRTIGDEAMLWENSVEGDRGQVSVCIGKGLWPDGCKCAGKQRSPDAQ